MSEVSVKAELRNCPFCGGEARLLSSNHPYPVPDQEERWYVYCGTSTCVGFRGEGGDRDALVAAWNRRHLQSEVSVKALIDDIELAGTSLRRAQSGSGQ